MYFININRALFQIVLQVIYLVCILGQRMCDQFEEFGEELGQCKWYSFPIGLQRMYAFFLVNAQQNTYMQGYGNLQCSREMMKKVLF